MNQSPYTPNGGAPDNQNNDQSYYAPPFTDPYTAPPQKQGKSFAVASLVLGIVSVVCCCFSAFSLICAVLAIVFAVLQRRRVGSFDGMSTAGLVCGIVSAALAVFSIISSLLNPVVLDESFWEMYYQMLEELQSQSGTLFRFLK